MEYYVSTGTDDFGNHEIHKRDCHRCTGTKKLLGTFENADMAKEAAQVFYDNCIFCSYCVENSNK